MEESVSFFKEAFRLKDVDAGQYSPLVLAYIGDAVYEIIIRTIVVNRGNAPGKMVSQAECRPRKGSCPGETHSADRGGTDA